MNTFRPMRTDAPATGPNWTAILPGAVLLFGLLLALVQYLYNRSLWVDEAMLALNIAERDLAGLLKPLDLQQVAPLLFLLLEKVFSTVIPNSEYGLRLLPLLSYVVAAIAFLRIVRHLFPDVAIQVLVVALFVFNKNLIYFASEVKQYMGDVAVCCMILWGVLRYTTQQRGLHGLALFATVAIWFSSITPILVVSACVYLLLHELQRPRHERRTGPLMTWAIVWCAMFGLYYFTVVHGHPAQVAMEQYWSTAKGLLPSPFTPAFYGALAERMHRVFTSLLPYGIMNFHLLPILWGIGVVALIRSERRGLLLLVVFPVLLHLLLAILHRYPFEDRLTLYLIPGFLLVAGEGAQRLLQPLSTCVHWVRSPVLLLTFPTLLGLGFLRSGFPREKQEIKPCLAFIAEHARPSDRIYVESGAQPAFRYYALTKRYELPTAIHFGVERSDAEQYLSDAMSLSGPTWFLFTHIRKRDTNMILATLKQQGLQPTDSCTARSALTQRYELAE